MVRNIRKILVDLIFAGLLLLGCYSGEGQALPKDLEGGIDPQPRIPESVTARTPTPLPVIPQSTIITPDINAATPIPSPVGFDGEHLVDEAAALKAGEAAALVISPTDERVEPPTSVPSPTVFVDPELCSPLNDYSFSELKLIVSNPFEQPRPNHDDGHHGIDLAHWRYKGRPSLEDVVIQSVFAGVVSGIVEDRLPYGNMVIIRSSKHQLPLLISDLLGLKADQAVYLLYAHMKDRPDLAIGQEVQCGAQLGFVGNSGMSGNAHLHFEIRVGPENTVFPEMAYYEMSATESERAVYRRWRLGGEFVPVDPMSILFATEGLD